MIKDGERSAAATRSSSTSGAPTTGSRRSSGPRDDPTTTPLTLRVLGPPGEWTVTSRTRRDGRRRVAGACPARSSSRRPRRRRSTSTVDARVPRRRPSSRPAARARAAGAAVHVRLLAASSRPSTGASASSSTATARDPAKQPAAFAKLTGGRAAQDVDRQPARLHLRPRPRRRCPARSLRARRRRQGHSSARQLHAPGHLGRWRARVDGRCGHHRRVDAARVEGRAGSPIGGGAERRFKVEYYDVDWFAELRFDIQRK